MAEEPHPSTIALGGLAVAWLAAIALQAYASNTALSLEHVGANLPAWALGVAAVPWWALVFPAAFDALAAAFAGRLSSGTARIIVIASAACLTLYAVAGFGTLIVSAFAQ